jgi:hypothetical protein
MLQEVQLTAGVYPYILLTDACTLYFSMLYWSLLVNLQGLDSSGILDGVVWWLVTDVSGKRIGPFF